MSDHHPYSQHICKVEPNLFFGSIFSTQRELLENYSIDHVFHFGFTRTEKLIGVCYEHFDIDDNWSGLEHIIAAGKKIVREIDDLLNNNKKVLVCCQAGRSRSATIIIMYLHHKYPHDTYLDIVAKIKQVRSIGLNKTFEDYLITNWDKL